MPDAKATRGVKRDASCIGTDESKQPSSIRRLFAGVDIGGTTISVGLVDSSGALTGLQSESLGQDHEPRIIAARVRRLLEASLAAETGIELSDLAGLGVCTPGLLDCPSGVVRVAANLNGWKEVPLVEIFSQELGLEQKVVLENDTNAALLAEAWVGAAAGLQNIVLMTLGTGIGGAILCDGRLLRGSRGQAGEIGHAILVPEGRSHGTAGVKGIFEGYASATAVALRAADGIPATFA